MPEDRVFQRRIQQIEGLIQQIDATHDLSLREAAKELVQALLEFHAQGLERMLEMVSQAGEAGERLMDCFGRDELVKSLLLLYGLHPLDVEVRVRQALVRLRASLGARAGDIELASIAGGVVRLRLSAEGCGAAALESAAEKAIYESAPDVAGLIIEGNTGPVSAGFVPLRSLLGGDGAGKGDGERP